MYLELGSKDEEEVKLFDPENNIMDQLLLERVLGIDIDRDMGTFTRKLVDVDQVKARFDDKILKKGQKAAHVAVIGSIIKSMTNSAQ